MLLVVCPNLAIDRVLEVDGFESSKVQRSRSVVTQPGGKGSNVARVFRQLGGDVVLVGFLGAANAALVRGPLEQLGIEVDAVVAYAGDSRTCTIVCDPRSRSHPTVINEESGRIDPGAGEKLLAKVRRWMPHVRAVLTTGSLSTGLPDDFYARILEFARMRGKLTGIDAAGTVLAKGLLAQPDFMKPNREEFDRLTRSTNGPLSLARHTALTFGPAGAVLIHEGKCLYARPPVLFDTNPIGAGDAFVAAYLKSLLDGRSAERCLRFAIAAAASDVSTLRPGFINVPQLQPLAAQVELRFLSSDGKQSARR